MTLIDRQALRDRKPRAVRELDVIAKRVAHSAAGQYGVSSSADDIAQEITMSFLNANDTPREDEDALPVEAFLRRAAKHRAVDYMTHAKKNTNIEDESTFDQLLSRVDAKHDDASAGTPTAADEAARKARTAARMSAAPGGAQRKRRTHIKHADHHQETRHNMHLVPLEPTDPVTYETLRLMRGEWGLTQDNLARYIGVTTHTLRNYEYHVVPAIPYEVQNRVRRIFNKMLQGGYPRLTQNGFADVANEWLHRMGCESGDYRALADFLGLPRSTTWRWFNVPTSHPKRDNMLKYDDAINALASRRNRRIKAILGRQKRSKKA